MRVSVCVYVRVRLLWYGSRTRLWCGVNTGRVNRLVSIVIILFV